MLDNFHKKDCNKELCKKSFENNLCGIPRTRIKRIISAFIKIYKSEFYFHQKRSSLLKEASCTSSFSPLGIEVSTTTECFVSPPDN